MILLFAGLLIGFTPSIAKVGISILVTINVMVGKVWFAIAYFG